MKFTGIVASLAVASTASALAIPQTPVDATLTKLNGALDNVEGLVGGLLSGVCQQVDLTQVQTELVEIKGQLTKLVPVSVPTKRDTMGTVNGVATPVTNVAGSEVGTVEGVAKPATDVAGAAVGNVKNTAGTVVSDVKNTAGNVVGTVQNTAGPVVGDVKNTVAPVVGNVKNTAGTVVGTVKNTASGPVDTVTSTVGVKRQDVSQLTVLAQSMVTKVKSGALDAAGLENILNIVGQTGGLSSITSILAVLQQ